MYISVECLIYLSHEKRLPVKAIDNNPFVCSYYVKYAFQSESTRFRVPVWLNG